MYRTLGRSTPDSSRIASTMGFNSIPVSLPQATILGTVELMISTPHFLSALPLSSAAFWITSPAITKSVATCSSNDIKWDPFDGSGNRRISSMGIGAAQFIGSGADLALLCFFPGTTTWHVAFPSPLNADASLPTTTRAAFSSTPIAGVDGSFRIIVSASSALETSFVPVASKCGTHIASTKPRPEICA